MADKEVNKLNILNPLDYSDTVLSFGPMDDGPTVTFGPPVPDMTDIVFNDGNEEIARIQHEDYKPTRITLDETACADTVIEGKGVLDVDVERVPDGYKVKKRVRRWVPQDVEIEEDFEMGPSETITAFYTWATQLDTPDLEAAVQVYYDIWNFENGNTTHQMRYTMLKELLDGRRS